MLNTLKEKRIVDKMFIYILIAAIVISLLLIIEIIVLGYPLHHMVTWIGAIILSGVSLYLYYLNRFVNIIKATFFVLMTFLVLPYGWLLSDIRSPFPLAYAFIILISVINLLEGRLRIILTIGITLVVTGMLILNVIHPQLFPVIEKSQLIMDALIQVPITVGASCFLLAAFANDLRNKNTKLKKLSVIDDLTGLFNRRYIYEIFDRMQYNSHDKRKIIIGILDVNKFKSINDNYGHIIGDQVLISIANHIEAIFPSSAIISRTGGDEFIVILDYSDDFNTDKFIEKFKKSKLEFIHYELINSIPITISGGFVVCSITASIDTMISKADKNMYQAKMSGRLSLDNSVVITECNM